MRVITPAVKKELPSSLIKNIWNFYDEGYKGINLDDYQFFTIQTDSQKTTLKMWQEVPPVFKIKSIPPFRDMEVWIINDGNVLTMLFPRDY